MNKIVKRICIVILAVVLVLGFKLYKLSYAEKVLHYQTPYSQCISNFVVEKRGFDFMTCRFYVDVQVRYRLFEGLDIETYGRIFEDGTILKR